MTAPINTEKLAQRIQKQTVQLNEAESELLLLIQDGVNKETRDFLNEHKGEIDLFKHGNIFLNDAIKFCDPEIVDFLLTTKGKGGKLADANVMLEGAMSPLRLASHLENRICTSKSIAHKRQQSYGKKIDHEQMQKWEIDGKRYRSIIDVILNKGVELDKKYQRTAWECMSESEQAENAKDEDMWQEDLEEQSEISEYAEIQKFRSKYVVNKIAELGVTQKTEYTDFANRDWQEEHVNNYVTARGYSTDKVEVVPNHLKQDERNEFFEKIVMANESEDQYVIRVTETLGQYKHATVVCIDNTTEPDPTAILVDSLINPFFDGETDAISEILKEKGYQVLAPPVKQQTSGEVHCVALSAINATNFLEHASMRSDSTKPYTAEEASDIFPTREGIINDTDEYASNLQKTFDVGHGM